MPRIEIQTIVHAPQGVCYQLALSTDLHTVSTKQTQEKIIAGVRTGILQLGDTVTFRARHFGFWLTLTSQITEAEAPDYFCDVMRQGAFKLMRHEHHFASVGGATVMSDVFTFESPFGWIGKVVDALILRKYLRRFLTQRVSVIKEYAEDGSWRELLPADALDI
ncbi:SRPBCC family protein [Hymenobacter jejuensis]|uniref:SRPBCC family protein n=1 Tax=Hymenobacter jejuensis TaxID=2502781 RepID=A0A5B8A6E3_9BACT|nr:SRPBCC family protein [Hymenobacter jejuensis]QDA61892.1 SRPBCC family protein [Hymenobacter jejuensis]